MVKVAPLGYKKKEHGHTLATCNNGELDTRVFPW